MRLMRPTLTLCAAAVAALAAPRAAAAQERGAFIVRLGRDTTAVESFIRTATRIEEEVAVHAPRAGFRRYVTTLGEGGVSRLEITSWRPGEPTTATPNVRATYTFVADSVIQEVRRDTSSQTQRIRLGRGIVPMVPPSAWQWLEVAIGRALRQGGDSVRFRAWYAGGGAEDSSFLDIRRIARDSVTITNRYDSWRASVDREGRILGSVPIAGTEQFSLERLPGADVAAIGNGWIARERQGGAMGQLSTRDTVRASAGGAALWIDYGRPSRRGRVIYGGVVPWGLVWRTGANQATQLRTDKALEMGGVVVPAGFYTLWTLPTPAGWRLIINSETGQWGTDRRPERDILLFDMRTSTLPQSVERFTISIEPSAQGGVLNLDWDTTRASIPFTVRQER
jgi:hypothetical protein